MVSMRNKKNYPSVIINTPLIWSSDLATGNHLLAMLKRYIKSKSYKEKWLFIVWLEAVMMMTSLFHNTCFKLH